MQVRPFSWTLSTFLSWCGALVSALALTTAARADGLVLLPDRIELSGPQARHRVLPQIQQGELLIGLPVQPPTWTISDPKVVRIENEVLYPLGNGQATLTATVGNQTASLTVVVKNYEQPFVWSFRNHVQPVLTKAGCNMGACHGAQAGKKGFKLSLRGYDADFDYTTLTRQLRGRRITPHDPARSLILTKPTGLLPHGGGVRFDVDALEYQVLTDWIAAGVPGPQATDRRIQRLEILPRNSVLKYQAAQQLLVRAHFSDGLIEDVTHWAKYISANGEVAAVDDKGLVRIIGHGEGAITALYLSQVVNATVSVPFENQVPADVFAQAPRRNFIDELVLRKLQALALPPSGACEDSDFLRRASLDTIGVLPTPEETRAFLADRDPQKRDKLIDSLLERPEFVDYWAYKWSDLLLVNSERLKPAAMWSYSNWIRNQVSANTPWDQLAYRLLTATGSTLENGATNYFVLHKDPQDLVETTSQAFLGMSIGCARCHDHPLEKWTNNQYYAMANMFARVRSKDAAGDGHEVVYSVERGDLVQPRTGAPQPPAPLDGQAVALESTSDRRVPLASWLVSPENPYFTRAITNRVWANFMGVGLVEKVDDLRRTNPASNEELLDALAKSLVERKYDLKSLMRTILKSHTYQRSSVPVPGNEQDRRFYSRYYPRRLMAEVALDAVSQVTSVPTQFPGYPAGWRAMQLPDANVASYFLDRFGRPDREVTCDCERTTDSSMVQAMHLSNGDTINKKLQAQGNRLDKQLQAKLTPEQLIDEAYLTALCRLPTADEKQRLLQEFASATPAELRSLTEDLYWGLLTSTEFLFNH